MKKIPSSLIKFFFFSMKDNPLAFTVFFLAPFLVILETNVIPYALKIIIDTIINFKGDKTLIIEQIKGPLWLAGIAWFGSLVFLRLIHWWEAYVLPKFEAKIRLSTLEYMLGHSYEYFSTQFSGSISNKINELPRAIISIKEIVCWNCISTFTVVIVALLMMHAINPFFSYTLGTWLVIHVILTLYFVQFINKKSEINAEDKGYLNGIIVDMISNFQLIKLFSNPDKELSYIATAQNKEITSNKIQVLSMNKFQLGTYLPITIMLGSTIYFLIKFWQREQITTGEFVFIFSMVFLISQQMWYLSNALASLFRDIGIAQQALSILTVPQQIVDAPDAHPIQLTNGEIIFDNVSFHYKQENILFKNMSINIKPGQKVGLVGLSGSGKSTFIKLILRFYDVVSGTIKIDDQDISKVTQTSLRDSIAVVPQDSSLLHRTLLENICYGYKNNVLDSTVIDSTKKVHCHDFIKQLKNSYYSLVGDRGVQLSGGQCQRLSIARSLLKNSKILILDEATSSMDSITEKYILESLNELMKDRTTIVIAHRLSTLALMNRILVFHQGQIIEDGDHNTLIQNDGHYARLWKTQMDGLLPKLEDNKFN